MLSFTECHYADSHYLIVIILAVIQDNYYAVIYWVSLCWQSFVDCHYADRYFLIIMMLAVICSLLICLLWFADCHYVVCNLLIVIMLIVIMLSVEIVIMLTVIWDCHYANCHVLIFICRLSFSGGVFTTLHFLPNLWTDKLECLALVTLSSVVLWNGLAYWANS